MGGKALLRSDCLNTSTSQFLNVSNIWMSQVLRYGRQSIALSALEMSNA
jgi:hypothetical protein